jgi:hypothetical protein
MPRPRAFRELRLLNGSAGDPFLFVDDQGRDNALLIDCGAPSEARTLAQRQGASTEANRKLEDMGA